MSFQPDELAYLNSIKSPNGVNIFSPVFIQFLHHFQLSRNDIKAYIDKNGEFQIEIEGLWLNTILFETPVLAIVNEIYFSQFENLDGKKNKMDNICTLATESKFKFSEFGTRRRFSFDWQEECLKTYKTVNALAGTSNVYFAMKMGLTPIGTMAHEWLQAGQALGPIRQSVNFMLNAWIKAHGGNLAIALTDVISSKIFFEDLSLVNTKILDGYRHDSGSPVDYGYMVIDHLKKFNIDPMTKGIVFSDGLTIKSAIGLFREFNGKIKVLPPGIGTSITNDVGHTALNIVLKMTECNGQPVAKISDSPGKGMCEDPEYVQTLKKIFGIFKKPLSVEKSAKLLGSEPPVKCNLVEAVDMFKRRHEKEELEDMKKKN